MRRSQPTRQTRFWPPFPLLSDERKKVIEKRNKNRGRPPPAVRFTLRAGEVGELKLQGCARGTPASFLAARDPKAYGVTV